MKCQKQKFQQKKKRKREKQINKLKQELGLKDENKADTFLLI